MRYFFSLLLVGYSILPSFSQTFSAIGGPLQDDGNPMYFSLEVQGLSPDVLDTNFGLIEVCVNIIHTWDDDLEIGLLAPDGTLVSLSNQNGGDGDNYSTTCFSQTATTPIGDGFPPFDGSYLPESNLNIINNGQVGNGTWNLFILDHYPGADTGDLLDWSISFGSDPGSPFNFESSNLPLVFVNTNGQAIVDDPPVLAEVGIIDNGFGNRNYITDPFNDYNGFGKIELRGQSSQSFDKKNYALETSDVNGIDLDASLLGFPLEEDWIFHGPYSDKTHLRNHLSMKIAREMGWYASRTQYFELFINNDYKGLYVLMEKIKRDKNRLDIAKLRNIDINGDQLTGGYIIKIDKGNNGGWLSDYNIVNTNNPIYFQHVYPKQDSIQPAQLNYIQNYFRDFEDALAAPNHINNDGFHYTEYVDLLSFVDFFIMNELSKNVDAYRLSTYLHKDRDNSGGKLTMGPVWDFNLAWYNADYCEGDIASGWIFQEYCDNGNPFWWDVLFDEPFFRKRLKCRWESLRENILSEEYLLNHVDSMAMLLDEAQERNFDWWNILGQYVWPNPSTPPTYQGEINNLKNWISNRLAWMDNQIDDLPPGEILSQITVEECESYTSPSGVYTWSESGVYQDTLPQPNGCDSIFHIDLTITDIDVVVELANNNSLFVDFAATSYQWLDCDNNFAPITGANSQYFTPPSDGSYAVQVELNGCSNISDCFLLDVVSLEEYGSIPDISLFPNPTRGTAHIQMPRVFDMVDLTLFNTMGQTILSHQYQYKKEFIMDMDIEAGVYFLKISTPEGFRIIKILKRNSKK